MKEYPYWWDTLRKSPPQSADRNPQSALRDPESLRNPQSAIRNSADVLIVGAGYTGLAAARQLATAGASVVVVEREDVGWGASSRNGGQVLTGMKLDPATLVARYGESHATRLFAVAAESIARLEALIAEEQIDCGFARTGHLQAASKPSHFEAFREEQALVGRLFGHRVELVSRAAQRSEVGTDAYHGLLVDEHSAALNPAQYVQGLAAAAERRGATIATGVAMTRLQKRPISWRVTTSAGEIEARDVLVATNGYTDEAAPNLQRRFVPIGSYIIATEPLSREEATDVLPRGRMTFDSKHFLHYFRLTMDRRLLFGGRAEFTQPAADTTWRAAGILRRDMAAVFPQLAGKAIEYGWGGNVAFTRDQMPHAGKLDGMFFAGGYCGHGIAMATYLGEQIARRLAGEPIDHPLFDDCFPPIPLYRGKPWFLPLAGAYYRVMDWLP